MASILISVASAYCTIIGFKNVFVSAPIITMFIAATIELGRIVLVFDLHHYWKIIPLYKKIPGLCMLVIAMSLSALGVFGFFADAHSSRIKEVTPILMQVEQLKSDIDLYNKEIVLNNEQILVIQNSLKSENMEKAIEKYLERDYVTKALNIQKDSQKAIADLSIANKEINKKIIETTDKITKLQIESETKAPSIAHLKYFSKLFGVDNDTSIIIFIVMIMLVFDTLAMYLMITSDIIGSQFKKKDTYILEIPDKNPKKDKSVKKVKKTIEKKKKILYSDIVSDEIVENGTPSLELLDKKVIKLVEVLKQNPEKINDLSFIKSLSKTPLIVSKIEQALGSDNELVKQLRAKLKGR
jgi:hypothetical protein